MCRGVCDAATWSTLRRKSPVRADRRPEDTTGPPGLAEIGTGRIARRTAPFGSGVRAHDHRGLLPRGAVGSRPPGGAPDATSPRTSGREPGRAGRKGRGSSVYYGRADP
ncbi:hypothetical protein GCM10019016_017290 [Streptomyces prasinosporus]|uniref:Uncharacterized protein n=1 Tax=Streptomyces prasinosporus TaxID=68256 RepID=A0ABP6TJ57_9ACTN